MSRFTNLATGVVVSVSHEKDDRFVEGWERIDGKSKPAPKVESDAPKRGPGRPKKSED